MDERVRALEIVNRRFPDIGWQVCINQFEPGPQTGHNSYRPRWRSDASKKVPAPPVDAEQHVAAYWLAQLLVHGIPPILIDTLVSEVSFQTGRLGWQTDDFLIVCERHGAPSRKLAGHAPLARPLCLRVPRRGICRIASRQDAGRL